MGRTKSNQTLSRPNVFLYHDYRSFLREWLAFKKASHSGFSIRFVAREAGLALGYLSMVLSGTRTLSANALAKLRKPLGLTTSEQSFLEQLRIIQDSDTATVRQEAMNHLQSFPAYKKLNPKEFEVYRYLTHWYYVTIREMTALSDFKLDAKWIQSRLGGDVSVREIERALKFLLEYQYIETCADGSVRPPHRPIECKGEVFRLALSNYHRELLRLAMASLDEVPSEQRQLLGFTLAVDQECFGKVSDILKRAYDDIMAFAQEPKSVDRVVHVELALFPVTKAQKK